MRQRKLKKKIIDVKDNTKLFEKKKKNKNKETYQ